ncbi:MAG TPA: hypothetical protein VFE24_14410 [Pirellulales bacterium]|jgi:hypothetical protein|nr:hypothetical protein [Pirellulales bacterium]
MNPEDDFPPGFDFRAARQWKRRNPYRRRVILALAIFAIGATVAVGLIVDEAVTRALAAENNLHATVFTIRLVDQFVVENGRWPRSWQELKSLKSAAKNSAIMCGSDDDPLNGWRPDLEQRGAIDFEVDLNTIATQDPRAFIAIRPIGPLYYEYRYGLVAVLQKSVRTALGQEAATPAPHQDP